MFLFIFAFLGMFSTVFSDTVPECNLKDQACLDKITVQAYSKYIDGDPELKMENLDPMHHAHIVDDFSLLKSEFDNTTISGFRDCKMVNVSLNAKLKLHFDLNCPKLVMIGKYIISGKLIELPVDGSGEYIIETKKYTIAVDAYLKLETGDDGSRYLMIKDFKQKSEPLEPMVYDFKNLFNGNKELADIVIKFANDNWLVVDKQFSRPVVSADLKKIFKNANKYLKTIPVGI